MLEPTIPKDSLKERQPNSELSEVQNNNKLYSGYNKNHQKVRMDKARSGNGGRMWKFKGKELIIKKPHTKYRSKYAQRSMNGMMTFHKTARSGQFNTYSQSQTRKPGGSKWATSTNFRALSNSMK